jgi:hypothetical protein
LTFVLTASCQTDGGGGRQNDGNGVEGVTGLKVLGMRDMNYKLMFLACTVQTSSASVWGPNVPCCAMAQQLRTLCLRYISLVMPIGLDHNAFAGHCV